MAPDKRDAMNRIEDDDEPEGQDPNTKATDTNELLNLTRQVSLQAVEEEENDNDKTSTCSSEDENAHLKKFIRPKGLPCTSTSTISSIRRNDSFESFLTRSERIRILGKDPPPPAAELARRSVKFRNDDDGLETIHEIERVSPKEKKSLWFNADDFDRQETEIKMTKFRWDNHVSGSIQFDEENNTLRGLEPIIIANSTRRSLKSKPYKHHPHLQLGVQQQQLPSKWAHARAVLEEIHRQKLLQPPPPPHNGCRRGGVVVCDGEAIRRTSLAHTAAHARHAALVGRADEDARDRAWGVTPVSASAKSPPTTTTTTNQVARKPKLGFLFWKPPK